jgi:hypothetical protein
MQGADSGHGSPQCLIAIYGRQAIVYCDKEQDSLQSRGQHLFKLIFPILIRLPSNLIKCRVASAATGRHRELRFDQAGGDGLTYSRGSSRCAKLHPCIVNVKVDSALHQSELLGNFG